MTPHQLGLGLVAALLCAGILIEQRNGVWTYSTALLSPPRKIAVDPDRALLESLFFEQHLLSGRDCSALDPAQIRVVRSPAGTGGGLGSLVAALTISLHSALLRNATYVGAKPSFGTWSPITEYDVFENSPCHEAFHRDPSRFPNQVTIEGGISLDQHTKHPLFRHKPLLWYYRELLRLYFAKTAYDTFFEKYGSTPLVKARMGGRDWSSWSQWRHSVMADTPGDARIAVHIRRGDGCFSKINPHRPPCTETGVYVSFAIEYIRSLRHPPKQPVFLLSTDDISPDVFEEFEVQTRAQLGDTPRFYHLDIDRGIYKPPAENTFIEAFLASEDQHLLAWTDFLMEMSMLSSADVLVAQFYSSFADVAFLLMESPQYASVDGALPCIRGGCPGPLDQLGDSGQIWDRTNGWHIQEAAITTGVGNALYHSLRVICQNDGRPSGYFNDPAWNAAFDVRRLWSVCFEQGCVAARDCESEIVRGCFY